jgi:hypothetical protein
LLLLLVWLPQRWRAFSEESLQSYTSCTSRRRITKMAINRLRFCVLLNRGSIFIAAACLLATAKKDATTIKMLANILLLQDYWCIICSNGCTFTLWRLAKHGAFFVIFGSTCILFLLPVIFTRFSQSIFVLVLNTMCTLQT